MRQLLPVAGDVDPVRTYLAAERPTPADRPWLALSMVSSVDGATSVGGRSGPLGGAPDREVFRAVRAMADVVLVAAGTARTERYGPVRLSEGALAARADAGRHPGVPRLAIVTGSLDLEGVADRFAEHDRPPLVVTTEDADEDRAASLAGAAEVRRFGAGAVDLRAALRSLHDDGARVVVCEGGPTLNATLVAAGLVDEVCATIAPTLAGGTSPRMVDRAPEVAIDLELASLLEGEGVLCGRWVRRPTTRPATAGAG